MKKSWFIWYTEEQRKAVADYWRNYLALGPEGFTIEDAYKLSHDGEEFGMIIGDGTYAGVERYD